MAPNNAAPFATPYPFLNPSVSTSQTGMLFVKDENEALNYPSLRGSMVPLFDSREGVNQFYIKTVDMAGNIKPLQIFKYEEITPKADSSAPTPVSAEEFNSLKSELAEIKQLLTSQHNSDRKPYRKENHNNG